MKLLLDQGLPRSTVLELQKLSIDSIHVGEIGMASSTDSEIINKALIDGLTVVTLDSDFHTILASNESTKPSIIRIRIEGLKSREMAEIIQNVLFSASEEVENGAAISVNERGIRIHNLPLV
jgi:predicted nuclease of predicted toxin-antitoxin system